MAETMVGRFWFRTKKDAKSRARDILHRPVRNVYLDGEDLEYLRALIGGHPDSEALIGPGISGVYVGTNYCNAPGFYVRRVDGTEAAFSYRDCLGTGKSHKAKVLDALRHVSDRQTYQFKQDTFREGMVCPVTRVPLEWGSDLHVDHVYPQFSEIARRYVEAFGGYSKIPLDPVKVPGEPDRLAYPHNDRFAEYHRQVAVLRLVHRSGNLRRPKAPAGRWMNLPDPRGSDGTSAA